VERHEEPGAADLATRLQSIAKNCGSHAKAAEDGLPAGFKQVDDVIVLLQPLRLAAAEPDEAALEFMLQRLAEKNFLTGSQAIGRGGIAAALVCGCAPHGFGFHAELTESEGTNGEDALFRERHNCALVSTRLKAHVPLANFMERGGQFTAEAIGRVTAGHVRVQWMGETLLEAESFQLNSSC
jgi:phosphoribosylformylglycinamidine (FGAM) synthase-like enzyme